MVAALSKIIKMSKEIINYSAVSTILTGNRTQITRSYTGQLYRAQFNHLNEFEKRFISGEDRGMKTYRFTNSKFISEKDPRFIFGIESDMGNKTITCEVEIDHTIEEVVNFYIFIHGMNDVLIKEDVDSINYLGITKCIINFKNLCISFE